MQVINIFGPPGSGKSATAAGLFYFLKLRGENCELVLEYAKDLVYDNALQTYLDRQEVIFAEQNQRLHRLRDHVDFAIIDSPLLLSTIYPRMNRVQKGIHPWEALPAFEAFVHAVHRTYDNMNIILQRPPDREYDPRGREHTEEQSEQIGRAIEEMLTFHDYPFTKLLTHHRLAETLAESVILQKSKNK